MTITTETLNSVTTNQAYSQDLLTTQNPPPGPTLPPTQLPTLPLMPVITPIQTAVLNTVSLLSYFNEYCRLRVFSLRFLFEFRHILIFNFTPNFTANFTFPPNFTHTPSSVVNTGIRRPGGASIRGASTRGGLRAGVRGRATGKI